MAYQSTQWPCFGNTSPWMIEINISMLAKRTFAIFGGKMERLKAWEEHFNWQVWLIILTNNEHFLNNSSGIKQIWMILLILTILKQESYDLMTDSKDGSFDCRSSTSIWEICLLSSVSSSPRQNRAVSSLLQRKPKSVCPSYEKDTKIPKTALPWLEEQSLGPRSYKKIK